METFIAIVGFLAILSVLVIIHELGHFVAALWAKVHVQEFGLGYPPTLLKLFKWRSTWFTLNVIPLGGFVKMIGEDASTEDVPVDPGKKSFEDATVFEKLVIISAGVVVNFLFGIFAFIIVYFSLGIPTTVSDARIATVQENSPAATAGLQVDSKINGFIENDELLVTATPEDVISYIQAHKGSTLQINVTAPCVSLTECPGPDKTLDIYARTDAEISEGQGSMGVVFKDVVYEQYPFPQMVVKSTVLGLEKAFELQQMIIQTVSRMIVDAVKLEKPPEELAGPVGIVVQAKNEDLFSSGWQYVLFYMGMLSINLAVMNSLPISPLDGGRALFITLAALFGKKNIDKIDEYITTAGYLLLLALIVGITAKDIYQLF